MRWGGRSASTPGRTANVAPCSVTTHQRSSRAVARRGPDLGQLGEHGVADRHLVERQQVVRGADDQLQILALVLGRRCRTAGAAAALDGRVVEDPLDQPARRHHVVERADRTVEPEVDAGDRRGTQARRAPRAPGIRRGQVVGDEPADPIERDGQDDEVGGDATRPSGATTRDRAVVVGSTRADPGRQPDLDARASRSQASSRVP